jgi:hypothetical protein
MAVLSMGFAFFFFLNITLPIYLYGEEVAFPKGKPLATPKSQSEKSFGSLEGMDI